jgi:RecA/RadA recombinase
MNAATQRVVSTSYKDTCNQSDISKQANRPKVPQAVTALQLLQQRQQQNNTNKNSFSLIPHSVEPWLQLHLPGIYELTGSAGSGKTQLALQWALTVAQSRDEHAAPRTIYYLSLSSLSPKLERLQQIFTEQRNSCNRKNIEEDADSSLHRIWTRRIVQIDDFWDAFHELTQRTDVHAVVLDSLADMFRGGDSHINHTERSNQLFRVAQQLLQRNIPCLVLNQMQLEDRPALGISWAHCVTRRYRIIQAESNTSSGRRRILKLEHAPEFGSQQASFEIHRGGIVSIHY